MYSENGSTAHTGHAQSVEPSGIEKGKQFIIYWTLVIAGCSKFGTVYLSNAIENVKNENVIYTDVGRLFEFYEKFNFWEKKNMNCKKFDISSKTTIYVSKLDMSKSNDEPSSSAATLTMKFIFG